MKSLGFCTHLRGLEEIHSSQLPIGSVLAVVAIWRAMRWMEDNSVCFLWRCVSDKNKIKLKKKNLRKEVEEIGTKFCKQYGCPRKT